MISGGRYACVGAPIESQKKTEERKEKERPAKQLLWKAAMRILRQRPSVVV